MVKLKNIVEGQDKSKMVSGSKDWNKKATMEISNAQLPNR